MNDGMNADMHVVAMTPILPGNVDATGQPATLGVMGGGQLGRMFVHAAQQIGRAHV